MWKSLIVAAMISACTVPSVAQVASATYGVDLSGHREDFNSYPGDMLVFFFVASDCPISRRYLPEMQRIALEFESRPVRFLLVYPNPQESAAVIRAQLADYHISLNALRDPDQSLLAVSHAHVTPEAAIFLPVDHGQRREVYRGRIDDRYISFGQEKPQATRHELEDAIHAALQGKPVRAAGGLPVGCTIVPRSMAKP